MEFGKAVPWTISLSICSMAFLAYDACADPAPAVKVNGAGGGVSVTEGTPVTVSVSLDPREFAGVPADWWVMANSPFGVYWLTPDGGWAASESPIRVFSGNLFGIENFPVLSTDLLPSGTYTFYFGVDTVADNGALDLDQIHYQGASVEVIRTPNRR